MESKTISDNDPCKKCGGRTALVSGIFYFEQDQEPYKSGIHETAINESGDFYLHGTVCDDCNELSNLCDDDRYCKLLASNRRLREVLEEIHSVAIHRKKELISINLGWAVDLIDQTLKDTNI